MISYMLGYGPYLWSKPKNTLSPYDFGLKLIWVLIFCKIEDKAVCVLMITLNSAIKINL